MPRSVNDPARGLQRRRRRHTPGRLSRGQRLNGAAAQRGRHAPPPGQHDAARLAHTPPTRQPHARRQAPARLSRTGAAISCFLLFSIVLPILYPHSFRFRTWIQICTVFRKVRRVQNQVVSNKDPTSKKLQNIDNMKRPRSFPSSTRAPREKHVSAGRESKPGRLRNRRAL
jgi:hypothetical protein